MSYPLTLNSHAISIPSLPTSFSPSPQLFTQNCITIDETYQTLTVCNVTASSAGWYSCLAHNLAGTTEFSVLVTVIPEDDVAPNITSRALTRIIASGEPLILDCIAEGNPLPKITWFKDEVSCQFFSRHNPPCLPLPISPASPPSFLR